MIIKSMESGYKFAFMEAVDCKSTEFEMKRSAPKSKTNTAMLARYKDQIYSIQTYKDIMDVINEFSR